MRRLGRGLVVFGVLAATAACGEDETLPRWVAGPVSGLVLDCTEAGQPAPKPSAYVTRGDLDGDGRPDFVVDTAKGCPANRALYCSPEGCAIDVLLSSREMAFGLHLRARSWELTEQAGRRTLVVRDGRAACDTAPDDGCVHRWVYDGGDLVEAPSR